MDLQTGYLLHNRYQIERQLGKGGFGAVYQARDLHLNILCAVKESLHNKAEYERQFTREASILATLRHPNLPRVTDYFFTPDQRQYLVMDYVEGEDLMTMLRQAGAPLSERLVLAWGCQICDALDYMHTQTPPVIHRDVKPANIRISSRQRAILVDFGIAKLFDPGATTTTGAQVLSPGYAPIEQYGQGGHTDHRTDIYSLGATLFTILTGKTPIDSLARLRGASQPAPRQLNPNISAPTEAAVVRAIEVEPEERFQSAAEFRLALEDSLAALGSEPDSQPASPPAHSTSASPPRSSQSHPAKARTAKSGPVGRRWLKTLGLLALVLILGLVSFLAGMALNPQVVPPTVGLAQLSPSLTPSASLTFTPDPTRTPTVPPATATRTPSASLTKTFSPTPTLTPVSPTLESDTLLTAPKDGMTLIYIPAGEFTMGGLDWDSSAEADEKPKHTVYLDAFWIDQTEVTNAMFSLFAQETGYLTEAERLGSSYAFKGGWQSLSSADWLHPQGAASSITGLEDHPVVQISWNDAVAYCEWAGRRLPTEAEWEKAARGAEERLYPWGNQPITEGLLNFADFNLSVGWATRSIDDGFRFTAPVGSYSAGASQSGVFDLAGNVTEWVADCYKPLYYGASPLENPPGPSCADQRVQRGGSWGSGKPELRVSDREWSYRSDRRDDFGFRCALTP